VTRWCPAALLGAAFPLSVASAEHVFTLVTVNGALPQHQQVLRVTKGDTVAVSLTSNLPGAFHLHGYRLAATVVPGKPAHWRFIAHATGRYRLEWHADADASVRHHGPPLALLEVMPK
jgi:hypothetical protein